MNPSSYSTLFTPTSSFFDSCDSLRAAVTSSLITSLNVFSLSSTILSPPATATSIAVSWTSINLMMGAFAPASLTCLRVAFFPLMGGGRESVSFGSARVNFRDKVMAL